MAYIYLCLAGSFLLISPGSCLISLCTSNSLEGSHVCDRLRLVQVKVTNPKTWNCIEDYPEHICQRISRRSSEKLKEIFKVQNESVCCPGWMDDSDELDCKRHCDEGFFGQGCKFECGCIHVPETSQPDQSKRCNHGTSRQRCNPVDGSCDCLDGFMGRYCNERCSPDFYGSNCMNHNEFTCKNGGVNHPTNGGCLCSSKYGGSTCEKDVNTTKLDCENDCIQNNTQGCGGSNCLCCDGWEGIYCTEPCEIGKKGKFCEETCCSEHGHYINKRCICADGYHGDECQHKCEEGRFGRNCKGNCSCPSGCDPVTGACVGCPAGFMGDRCTEYCSPTQYGPTCNQACSCNVGEICDIFTGDCFLYDSMDKTDSVKKHGLLIGCLLPAVLVLVVCGFIVRKRCKKCKKTNRPEQNGHSTRSNSNFYFTVLGTPTSSHREESSISDGYTRPSDGNHRQISKGARTQREESVTSDGQTYITSVASSTGYSTTSSGYTKPSDGNHRQISKGARTYREESVTSDGYTKPSDGNICPISHGARRQREQSVTSDGYCKPSKINSYSTTIYSSAKPPSHRAESTSSSGYLTPVCNYSNKGFVKGTVSNFEAQS